MTYTLISKRNGIEIKTGDIVTDFRGERWICRGFTPPRHPGSTGRINVRAIDENTTAEFYPTVFDAEIIKTPPLTADLSKATAETVTQLRKAFVPRHEIIALNIDEARVLKDALRIYALTFATNDAERIADELEIEITRLITLMHHKGA